MEDAAALLSRTRLERRGVEAGGVRPWGAMGMGALARARPRPAAGSTAARARPPALPGDEA